jgi:hypothetical protein
MSGIGTKSASMSVRGGAWVGCASWSIGLLARFGDRVSAIGVGGSTIRGLRRAAMSSLSTWSFSTAQCVRAGPGGDRLRALPAASGVRQEDQIRVRLQHLLRGSCDIRRRPWGRCRRCPNRPEPLQGRGESPDNCCAGPCFGYVDAESTATTCEPALTASASVTTRAFR